MYLYEYAKQELSEIAAMDQPFAFTMLTVDTHHVGGYSCDLCESDYEENYDNVLRCASRQVYEFVQWIMAQDFYEDTVIVICGDHPSMDGEYSQRNLNLKFEDRFVYNCFINTSIFANKTNNRMFTAFDMYPTTLSALGCEIEGNRLGLGVNLFSDETTLIEKFGGLWALTDEIKLSSNYYNTHFLYNLAP